MKIQRETAAVLLLRASALTGLVLLVAAVIAPGATSAGASQQAGDQDEPAGIAVEHAATVENCVRCHAMDDDGRMTRISYERKTPEGWQESIRRMVLLNGVELEPEVAREIVRYLSDSHGLAPEEARPGFFEAERRMIDHDYDDDDTEALCIQCHSMGRVITQRRTQEEWQLLVAMHRGYFPFVDFQGNPGFRRPGPPPEDGDTRHPMEKAIAHLAATYPFESDEWTAWSANRRTPRVEGRWAFAGQSAYGPGYGYVDITAVEGSDGQFTTEGSFFNPRNGNTTTHTGTANVYTGFQWRGRSTTSNAEWREAMLIERDWRSMSGRWFTGAYDEFGFDVTLYRGDGPRVSGIHPVALRTGTETGELTIFGINLPIDLEPDDIDFGARVTVTDIVSADPGVLRLRVSVATDAAIGKRDLVVGGIVRPDTLAVYDKIDAVRVTPEAGMARLGGAVAPPGYVKFDAIGVSYGPDGEAGTADDLDLGAIDVAWSMEEYAATFDDDDIEFVGELNDVGFFQPALDGPNPERSGERNNVGDVWVVATYEEDGLERPLRGRAHLVVTVPLYLNFSNWQPGGEIMRSGGPPGGR